MQNHRRLSLLPLCLVVTTILSTFGYGISAEAQTYTAYIPANFSFSKNLKLGRSANPDVNYLQYFLDQDQRTAVVASGPGSANDTTSYFGLRTLDAVMRFQSLYESEILTLAGLTQPTGYFGQYSRTKANALLAHTQNPAPPQQQPSYTGAYYQAGNYSGSASQGQSTANQSGNSQGNGTTGNYSQGSGNSTSTQTTDGSGTVVSSDGQTYTTSTDTSSSNGSYIWVNGAWHLSTITASTGNASSSGSGSSSSGSGSSAAGGAIGGVVGAVAGLAIGAAAGQAGSAGTISFGGKVSRITECTCGASRLVEISGGSSGNLSLIYMPGATTLYANYSISQGKTLLGNYTAGGVCMVVNGTSCRSEGMPRGTMRTVGTD